MQSSRTARTGWLLVALQFALLAAVVLLPRRPMSSLTLALGVALMLLGLIVVALAFVRLGDALTPTPVPRAEAGLRTTGVYRLVRHPIYSGVLLVAAGITIAIGTWWTLAWFVVLVVFFLVKSRWEDRLLSIAYGDDWRQWAQRTGALLPRIQSSSTRP